MSVELFYSNFYTFVTNSAGHSNRKILEMFLTDCLSAIHFKSCVTGDLIINFIFQSHFLFRVAFYLVMLNTHSFTLSRILSHIILRCLLYPETVLR